MIADIRHLTSDFEKRRILIVGEAILDSYWEGCGHRLCQEGPVPIVEDCRRHDFAGGAANVAVNVAGLGGAAVLLSATGADEEGSRLRELLESAAVVARVSAVEANRRTLLKQRVVCDGQIVVRFDRGSKSALGPLAERQLLAVLEEEHAGCDAVVISDYAYGIVTDGVIERLAELQRKSPRLLVVDSKSPERLRNTAPTVVKPNYAQAAALLGLPALAGPARIRQIEPYAKCLLEVTGARSAAVSLDADGALLLAPGARPCHVATRPVPVSRTSGAGDTFCAALALSLAGGAPLFEAGKLAVLAASVVVRGERKRSCPVMELVEACGAAPRGNSFEELVRAIEPLRAQDRRIVLTNGCFDILHRGHIEYLHQAKKLGDVLVVGVNSDESIRRLKGPERPINTLEDRLHVLSGLASVDIAVPFGEDTPHRLIEAVRPDVFVKGGDYTRERLPEAELVERLGGRVVILNYVADRSTTTLIDRISHVAARRREHQPVAQRGV